MTDSQKIEKRAVELYYSLSPDSSVTLWISQTLKVQTFFRRLAIDELFGAQS